VPFYQKYIQKSRLTSRVFPGIHSIQTNVGSYFSFNNLMPGSTLPMLTQDANTTCFSIANPSTRVLSFTIKSSGSCPELANLAGLVITTQASIAHTQIVGWIVGGSLATQLGLSGLN
jgi:type IV pilus assembly protein PilA